MPAVAPPHEFRRGLAAPLFFCALAIAAAGSLHASPSLWIAALAFASAAAWAAGTDTAPPNGVMAWAVFGYAAWLVATNAFANPSYTAAAPYHAAFLVAGFVCGCRLGSRGRAALFGALAAFAAALAGYALWQLSQGAVRAHGHFETPATLASTLNLALLPLLVVAAWRARSALVLAASVLVSAGVAAAMSRGGWLALGAALLVALALARRAGLPASAHAGAVIALLIGAGAGIAWLAPMILKVLAGTAGASASAELPAPLFGETASLSSLGRMDLYALALQGLGARPLLGIGYLGFYYVFQANPETVSTYDAEAITYFVHNDYLQHLLELGVPGGVAFLGVALFPLVLAWKAAPRVPQDASQAIVLVAAASGCASMSAHAIVDFPFFIPVCLLAYGALAGVVDRARAEVTFAIAAPGPMSRSRLARVASALLGAAIAWTLALPIAAEAAAALARQRWETGRPEAAAYWFEVARRIERRDWRYHWYAGQFWLAQAAQNRSPVAARLADEAFAAGLAANPREVRNLVARIETQRLFGALLESAVSPATLLRWAGEARAMAPLNREVRRVHELVLRHASGGSTR